jgi:anaerobic dimethyl sulfoxide reductase subunit C (anchor subunit)
MEVQWTLVFFTAISGVGAWLFVSAVLGELFKKDEALGRVEAVLAVALLATGGFLSVLHLEHPGRILEALNRPTSGIFIEAALIGLSALAILVYLVLLVRGAGAGARRTVAVIGALFCAALSFACGSSYMMAARPAWDNLLLPIAYLGTAAAAGASLNLLIKALRKTNEGSVHFAGVVALVCCAVGAVSALAFCLSTGSEIFGMESNLSIGVIVLAGAFVIALISSALAMKRTKSGTGLAAIAAIGSIVGAIALRASMWLLGTPILDFFHLL